MLKSSLPKILSSILFLGFSVSLVTATPAGNARSVLEQWVATEKLISEERNQWQVERAIIDAEIETLESEIAILEERIARAEETTSAADVRRRELTEQADAIRAQVQVIETIIPQLEGKLKALLPRLPESLQASIRPFVSRLPAAGEATRLSSGQRVQLLVGSLQQVDNFSRQVNVVRELQTTPDGRTAEVSTLYFGLGIGYFVDGTQSYAGFLTPGANGWEATNDVSLARRIANAVAVYDTSRLAEFIPLPVVIK
jgi:hypothetical protein